MSAVPLDVFRPVVEKVLASCGQPADMEGWRWLGQRVNVHEDTIYRVMVGKKDVVDFDLADLILTRCGAAQLWHMPPLNEIYWTLPLECRNCDQYLRPKFNRTASSGFCSQRCEKSYVLSAS